MKLLLIGKNGQVGFELQRALAPLGVVVAVDRAECDVSKPDAIRQTIRETAPDVIVNAAAYTSVDKAEVEKAQAFAVNGAAPGILGEEAARTGAVVVHYSTDYVFDGTRQIPYTESDTPNPLSVYGTSKLAGEAALQRSGADYLILRTSWVFGAHGGNFAKTILRLAADREGINVVADQYGAPTSAALIADVTGQIIGRFKRQGREDFPFGLYHVAAGGATTWHEYALAVVRAAHAAGKTTKLKPENVQPITTAEYPVPAPRPMNSRLDTSKLHHQFDLTLPNWRQGLSHALQQIL